MHNFSAIHSMGLWARIHDKLKGAIADRFQPKLNSFLVLVILFLAMLGAVLMSLAVYATLKLDPDAWHFCLSAKGYCFENDGNVDVLT
jgi:hypothetical protein